MYVILADGRREKIHESLIEKYAIENRVVCPFSGLRIGKERAVPFFEKLATIDSLLEEANKKEEEDERSEWDM